MNKTAHVLSIIVVLTLVLGSQGAPILAQESDLPPLSEPGPYDIGLQVRHFKDEIRGARRLVVAHIWYPATMPENGVPPQGYLRNADPDTSDAPYPLIIFSHYYPFPHNPPIWQVMSYYLKHLASHGYVVVLTEHASDGNPLSFIDRPLDVLLALDQLEEINESELAGLIDFDNVGMTGYGYGAYTALLLSGAQIDPEYYLNHCANTNLVPPIPPKENPFYDTMRALDMCFAASNWDTVTAYYEELVRPLEEGELWPSYADERIRAVLPVAPIFTRHFGPDGLAMVTIPTLVVVGETDRWFPGQDWPFVYEHLGAEERYKLTLANAMNGFGLDISPGVHEEDYKNIIKHFATAFFGYYLQGRQDYAQYLTVENAEDFNPLVEWERGE